ncbi:Protein N-acetyltransferase, RimJ/RimL family [Chryseobacterium piscicola]|jgi:RimJ/RimL family protein N-acetyltransferase|uniref:GNAT family N-acetyltransferase n=1 Tax=Chryseobacterium piscicola TaxID=551459 RepID=A0A1N7L6N4_9FLAO|nr:GNAT family N-acetyltransferase [Chryseobacterium piscicola]PQA97403.1 GNAT family N-acetyltransferase [Chryseobacterium piscicola]SIS69509.1 Protein N-acetyltransferase, RimJ/RimL family [Chryseobacterium piscicola]
MAKIFIETERLILREIMPEDAEAFFAMDSNPEVVKYVGTKPLTNINQSVEMIEKILTQYAENGIGRWAVITKEDGKLIGWSGLKRIEKINNHQNIYDLGYRFIPKYWGKGYATETSIAVLNYAFNEMKLDEVFAYADVGNDVSNHILKKLGFQEKNRFIDEGDDCFWYELKKENYKL